MHDFILRCLAWARAVFRPETPGCESPACRPAQGARVPSPMPEPPLADPPTASNPHFIWITAHGIDFRPRQPHGAEVSR